MKFPVALDSEPAQMRLLTYIAMALWITLTALSFFWNWRQMGESVIELATTAARSSFDKDVLYRRWATAYGGVYVSGAPDRQPQPYLSQSSGRDVVTTGGMQLTLINPASMTRQVHDLEREERGVHGHIASLKPISRENAPDAWEAAALHAFESGTEEVSSLEMADGELCLRLMGPLLTEPRCLKCHQGQGYNLGDIRGGISVSVPFAPYAKIAARQRTTMAAGHLLIGTFVLLGLWYGGRHFATAALERKRAAEDLRESEMRFKLLYERAPLSYQSLDVNGNFIDVNQTWLHTLGYTKEEVIGRNFGDFLPPDWVDHFKEHFPRFKAVGEILGVEFEMVKKDGSTMLVSFHGRICRDIQGHFQQTHCIFQDITERRRAEEALRESEEAHRALVEGLPDIVMRFDRKGRHLFVSDKIEKLVDVPPARCMGKTALDLGFPDKLCRFWLATIREVFDSGTACETEFQMENGKSPAVYSWRLLPERDAHGRVKSVLSLIRDITAYRRTERDYQTLFREMLNGFSISEIICDEYGNPVDYRFVVINPAFERLTGREATDLIGRTVLEVFPETESYWIETFGRVAMTGEPALNEYYSVSTDKYYEFSAFRNAPNQCACIFSDSTDRKRAEKERNRLQNQLAQAQKIDSVGRLAGGVAHDFNNMLGVILGHAEMALADLAPDQPIQTHIKAIQKAARHSADLTRQLLAFARKQTVNPKILDLNDTVAGMIKMLQRLIGEEIDLAWVPGHALWHVRIDPSQVDQVLANLAINARDAIGGVGKVTIETNNVVYDDTEECAPGEYVQLAVSDNGAGMSKAIMDHIFEPFFTTKEVGKGTGLGLSTVYGIVTQNQGFIKVYSEPNHGTTFKIHLPRVWDDAAVEHAAQNPPGKAPSGTETILIVEDETALRVLCRTIMEGLGYVVLTAETPGEAIRLAKEHAGKIQLLITDVVMPEMNGQALAQKLTTACPGLKCLFMSGYTADAIARHGVLDEGVHFVQKPFSVQEIGEKVREILNG